MMIKLRLVLVAITLVLVLCSPHKKNDEKVEAEPSVLDDPNTELAIISDEPPDIEAEELDDLFEYFTEREGELSIRDSQTAYEMCTKVLTDYYKAVWNGSEIELDSFIENNNLKQYMLKKIQSQYELHAPSDDPVQKVEIGTRGVDWEVKYTEDAGGGFLYLYLPAEINKTVGSYGEPSEFLVRNNKGRLIIVDWYIEGKDSYDFLVRGENETIDNPDIWNDPEWVKNIEQKQNNFSGSTR